MGASYDFVLFDVFSRTPPDGNPLKVFTRGLKDKRMQALADEMKLAKTIHPAVRSKCRRLRSGITPSNRNPVTIDEL